LAVAKQIKAIQDLAPCQRNWSHTC